MSAMYQPLADRLRPNSIDEVVGQRHLLGPNGVLRRIIESGVSANMVFYGPPARERPRWRRSPPPRCTGPSTA